MVSSGCVRSVFLVLEIVLIKSGLLLRRFRGQSPDTRKEVRLLLQMDTDTLKELTWDLITHATSASLIEAVWNAI